MSIAIFERWSLLNKNYHHHFYIINNLGILSSQSTDVNRGMYGTFFYSNSQLLPKEFATAFFLTTLTHSYRNSDQSYMIAKVF